MDKELEMLCKRPWEFLAKAGGIPHQLKSPIGELMEAYIRQAYVVGKREVLRELIKNRS